MSLADILGTLEQYAGGQANHANAENDFQHVAQNAEPTHLAGGLSGAFQSGQGGGFPQMISQLFSNSNGEQRSGILSHLLSAAGPGAAGGMLGNLLSPGQQGLAPEQAQQISPEQVQDLARQAQSNNPSIVQEASNFYAQHPKVVQALGAGALAMIMSHMTENRR